MIAFIFGLILLAAPFVLLSLFKDKKRGFIFILFFLISFHTVLALTTQILHIFYYWVIIVASAIADIILAGWIIKHKPQKLSLSLKSIDWVLFAVILISILTLYQVHYNYTGGINVATDSTVSYHSKENMKYVYPYFSDEWYAVLLTNKTIDTHSLPTKNFDNSFFLNMELFFHSFLAEIVLILGIDPLLQYSALSVFANLLIVVLVYLFLRINKLSTVSSSLPALSVLYITPGANLPGIWSLIPLNSGIILSLIGFCFLAMDSLLFGALSLLMVSLFYAPLTPFFAAAATVFLFYKLLKDNEKMLKRAVIIFVIFVLCLPVIYIIWAITPAAWFLFYITGRSFFISFSGNNTPQLNFLYIIPWQAILFFMFGVFYVYKNKKWLFYSFLFSAMFWFFYSLTTYRLMVEFERVVIFTSVLTILISGFGIEKLVEYMRSKNKENATAWLKGAQIGVLALFLIFVPSYTQRDSWKNLVLKSNTDSSVYYPKSPANNYLVPDDLRIFKGVENKKFLSMPWKGTVVGVATGNYPVITKEGTISNGSESDAFAFMLSSCEEKNKIAKNYAVDYVYVYDFNCPGFKKISQSNEGFVLFEVLK